MNQVSDFILELALKERGATISFPTKISEDSERLKSIDLGINLDKL